MKSRTLRYAVAVLFVGILIGAAYLMWVGESEAAAALNATRRFDTSAHRVSRALAEIKSAQAGYVAAGQGEEYWTTRVDALLGQARDGFAEIRAHAATTDAQEEIDTAEAALEDFEQMDRRAREYARSGQRLLASDLVFSDGIDKMDAAVAALSRARDHELAASDSVQQQALRHRLLTLGGAAAFGLIALALLVPLPRAAVPAGMPPRAGSSEVRADHPLSDRFLVVDPPTEVGPAPARTPAAERAAPAAAPSSTLNVPAAAAQESSAVDLAGIASVCSELARVVDPGGLPAALEHAATLLQASGIVIWVADPDGRELVPVVAHGYSPHVLNRLGTIDRDAENVTAAAFRTGVIQTVKSDGSSPGAIATPLLTPSGPIGVMAAEMMNERERHGGTLSASAIVAAQLATLMAPPPRPAKTEAAGA